MSAGGSVHLVKSAYELALERLQKDQPSRPLTAEQKEAIAEVESRYKAKIAEREISLGDSIQSAEAAGDLAKAEELREDLTRERMRLESEREEKKAAIRAG